jgi:cytochrome c peroxidase
VRRTTCLILFCVAIPCSGLAQARQLCSDAWLRPPAAPAPADNAVTPERIALGRMLFFDTRLSAKQSISCASCHNPALAWTDGRATAVGHDGKILPRATPTILNAAFNGLQMWDGRKATLEEQALGPFGADEQNLPLEELERRVLSNSGYRALFDRAYPDEGVTRATIAKAIASFERTVLSTESPFDRWCAGDAAAISAAAQRGFELFQGRAQCTLCHQGFNFTDDGFHNVGLAPRGGSEDLGRFNQVPIAAARGAFKTPTLRDVALTAPYMHDGRYATLEEVIDHYDRGGDVANSSPNMKPLNLSADQKRDLSEFLRSLTGAEMTVAVPRLPQSNPAARAE